MNGSIYILAIIVVLGAAGTLFTRTETRVAAQYVQRCAVSDPSGSPLNVRSAPNGKKIVGKLKNGTRVAFDTESGDGRDRSWAHIRLDNKNNKKPLGWVLREYLDCE